MIARLIAAACCLGAIVSITGCVTETSAVAPEREHRAARRPVQPSGIKPVQMMLSAGVASDTDGNNFPDTIPVVVYLFGDTRRYALPIKAKGTFEFFLEGLDGARLGHWVFPPEETAKALGGSEAGANYRFMLRMDPRRERMPSRPASLRAIFTVDASNDRVFSTGTATIRVGAGN